MVARDSQIYVYEYMMQYRLSWFRWVFASISVRSWALRGSSHWWERGTGSRVSGPRMNACRVWGRTRSIGRSGLRHRGRSTGTLVRWLPWIWMWWVWRGISWGTSWRCECETAQWVWAASRDTSTNSYGQHQLQSLEISEFSRHLIQVPHQLIHQRIVLRTHYIHQHRW